MTAHPLAHAIRDAKSTAVPTLTVGEERFAREYIKDNSGWAAAVRAGYGTAGDYRIHEKLLARPEVQNYLVVLRQEHIRQAVVGPAEVLREMWEIATADAGELTCASRVACRRCYGVDFAYQYKGEWEYMEAFEEATRALAAWTLVPETQRVASKRPQLPVWPSDGQWFDWKADPNPDCPHCEGRGVQHIEMADTRRLSAKARRLFAGVKVTNSGWEVKTRDQDAALKAVAAAIGMITEGNGVSVAGASQPITREQLAKLKPEQLDQMIELQLALQSTYDPVPQAPAIGARGDHDAVAREGERE